MFVLDRDSITIKDKQASEFLTATVTRKDDEPIDVVYKIYFPDNKSTVYPTDVDGNRIKELYTRPLRGKDARDTVQFKVWATKYEDEYSTKKLDLQLYVNSTHIEDADLSLVVNVE